MKLIVDVRDEVDLGGSWSDEVGQVLIRRQESVFDDGRDRHLVVERTEELIVAVEIDLILAISIRRRGRQSHDDGAVEKVMRIGEDSPPVTEQMMALIQHDQSNAAIL